jgi:hypothetical protein
MAAPRHWLREAAHAVFPIIAALLVLVLGLAQLTTASAAVTTLAPPQAQERFTQCGFDASTPTALDAAPLTLPARFTPLEPHEQVAIFVVRDIGETTREDGRALTVLVFQDQDQAQAAFARGAKLATVAAGLQDAAGAVASDGPAAPPALKLSPDHGPPLLFGHGLSVWRGNLALAQLATPPVRLLQETATALEQRNVALRPGPADYEAALRVAAARTKSRRHDDPRGAPYEVDQDFVACVDGAQPATAATA